MRKTQSGFTLVEIAIVLVIIGLLLGGILKGQELVNNARVRNVADQMNGYKAAFFAFQDRYHALPGDFANASNSIPNVALNGDGNGQIDPGESVLAWHHMTNAGFISCAACVASPGAAAPASAANSPTNTYSGVMGIGTDNSYYPLAAQGAAATANVTNIKTGNNIPSNVLADVDTKIDDGNPNTGSMRFSVFAITGAQAPSDASCLVAATGNGATGFTGYQGNTPAPNCGAALFMQ